MQFFFCRVYILGHPVYLTNLHIFWWRFSKTKSIYWIDVVRAGCPAVAGRCPYRLTFWLLNFALRLSITFLIENNINYKLDLHFVKVKLKKGALYQTPRPTLINYNRNGEVWKRNGIHPPSTSNHVQNLNYYLIKKWMN